MLTRKQYLSFVHRPAFDINKNPLVVSIALGSIGACYSVREGAHDFASAVAELNLRLLLFMVSPDNYLAYKNAKTRGLG